MSLIKDLCINSKKFWKIEIFRREISKEIEEEKRGLFLTKNK